MFETIRNLFKNNTYPRVEFRAQGRSGNMAYVTEIKEAVVYFEMSGSDKYDILVGMEYLDKWSNEELVNESDKLLIYSAFKEWAHKNKFRVQW